MRSWLASRRWGTAPVAPRCPHMHRRRTPAEPPGGSRPRNKRTRSACSVGMRIEIWSDIACPWCYIGKRRLETAVAGFEHGDDVEVVYRSFQLDPTAPTTVTETAQQMLADRYGVSPAEAAQMQARVTELAAAEGMTWRHDETLHTNTLHAHRLLHLAKEEGRQGVLKEA